MYEIFDSMVCNKNSYFTFRFDFVKKKKNRSTKLVLIVAFILKLMTN